MPRNRRRLVLGLVCGAVLLAPGWSAVLEPADHDALLAASRAAPASRVFGVSLGHDVGGERWHAQFVDRSLPVVLHDLGMGGTLPKLVPPDFAAHIPAGAERADGYFRVVTAWHWPWWRPGGGVVWAAPGSGAR